MAPAVVLRSSTHSKYDDEFQWLSWDMPPEESFSDWTIQITSLGSTTTPADGRYCGLLASVCCSKKKPPQTTTRTFHVHKNMLAFGPKKCAYFSVPFKELTFMESETKTSEITLNAMAAAAFPFFLDYVYSPVNKLEITTSNAVALYHLGQYFGCHALREEAIQFCKRNISIGKCGTYYEHAKVFHADEIMGVVTQYCCLNLQNITPDSQLMEVSDAALWKSIIHWILEIKSKAYSKHLSLLILEFCTLHQDQVDAETFAYFTDAITVIDKKAAIPLLQLEGALIPESNTSDKLTSLQSRCIEVLPNDKDFAVSLLQLEGELVPESKTSDKLTCLQSRCIEVLPNSWTTIAGLNPNVFLASRDKIPINDKDFAVSLLQLEGELVPESKTSDKLTCLQLRCVEVLANSWTTLDVTKLKQDLAGLNPNIFKTTRQVLEKVGYDKIPINDKDFAVSLLQLEGELVPESKTSDKLTCLQSRCVEVLANSWTTIDVTKLKQDLVGLNPNIFKAARDKQLEGLSL